jgi:hypothetical protein
MRGVGCRPTNTLLEHLRTLIPLHYPWQPLISHFWPTNTLLNHTLSFYDATLLCWWPPSQGELFFSPQILLSPAPSHSTMQPSYDVWWLPSTRSMTTSLVKSSSGPQTLSPTFFPHYRIVQILHMLSFILFHNKLFLRITLLATWRVGDRLLRTFR